MNQLWLESGFLFCEKMKGLIKSNRVKYLLTNCNNNCISVFVSATGFGISLKHNGQIFYKHDIHPPLTGEPEDEQKPVLFLLIVC